jgi:hypothetical protein
MAWLDGPLVLYHGTDGDSAADILRNGVNWRRGNPGNDFGRGFYTTTVLRQAVRWAGVRSAQARAGGQAGLRAVLRFTVPRTSLDGLNTLCFILPDSNPDYWQFVEHCRRRNPFHRPLSRNYDVVFGPVSKRWRRHIVIPDCDQVSFHTELSRTLLVRPSSVELERLEIE